MNKFFKIYFCQGTINFAKNGQKFKWIYWKFFLDHSNIKKISSNERTGDKND